MKVPPGPRGWPLLGSLPEYRRDPLRFLTSTAYQRGAVTRFHLATQEIYLVNDPDIIQDVLVTRNQLFSIGLVLRRTKLLLGEGLLTSTGEFHKRQRRLIQPAFHRERLMNYGRMMIGCGLRARDQWQPGMELDLSKEMMRLTLAVVGQTLFSTHIEDEADDIGRSMAAIMALYPRLLMPFSKYLLKLPLASNRRFFEAKALLDRTILGLVEQRRATGEDKGDLLSMLLMAQDEDGSGGMSDTQVRDELLTLFLAGHETTANALSWTWYLLATHPETEEKLHTELHEVLGDRDPTVEDLPRLKFTEKVFAEALRLYPPAWVIGRRTLEPFTMGQYTVPANAILLLSPYVMQRNATYFDEPEAFHPERWTAEFREQLPKFCYFPFGGGPRLCIGERFAWMEGTLLLATIAQKHRFQLVPGHIVETRPLITLRMKHGLKVQVR